MVALAQNRARRWGLKPASSRLKHDPEKWIPIFG
jgi:hypothetical protein